MLKILAAITLTLTSWVNLLWLSGTLSYVVTGVVWFLSLCLLIDFCLAYGGYRKEVRETLKAADTYSLKHASRYGSDGGFTMLEVLGTLSIIAVLLILVTPQIAKAQASLAVSDLKADARNVVEILETGESQEGEYPSDAGAVAAALSSVGVDLDAGTAISAYAAEDEGFSITLTSTSIGDSSRDSVTYASLTRLVTR